MEKWFESYGRTACISLRFVYEMTLLRVRWDRWGAKARPTLWATRVGQVLFTFQKTGEEPLTIPEMLLRQALGVNHWPVGM